MWILQGSGAVYHKTIAAKCVAGQHSQAYRLRPQVGQLKNLS